MPEKDSSPDNFVLARKLAKNLNVEYIIEDITDALYGFKSYQHHDDEIRNLFAEYNISYKAKIILAHNILNKNTLNVFYLTIISPEGDDKSVRILFKEYLQIVAASNFKKRSRICML